MKRRAFLSTSLALGAVPVIGGVSDLRENFTQSAASNVQYFEWIRYQLHTGKKQGLVAEYYHDVAIPALNKAGINNIGVFNVKNGPNAPTLHVIIPHPSLESIVSTNDKLLTDKDFVQAGSRFLESSISDTAFVRMEKSILKAFDGLPQIQVPEQKKSGKPRIFQVRTYESHNLVIAKRKIQMFNEGEIDVFIETGLQPVLFGEVIAGDKMPCLIYILAFENMDAMAENWTAFGNHPGWIALRDNPYYANTVSCINDWLWTPASCSQI